MLLRKTLSITLIILFVSTNCVLANIAEANAWAPPTPPASQPTVFHIQDIHANYDAQKNIHQIITDLLHRESIDFIALEGIFNSIDLSSFRNFPNQDIISQTAEYLLKEHQISGAIYSALNYPKRVPDILGVDHKGHYNANVQAYLDTISNQSQATQFIQDRLNDHNSERRDVFNPELLHFDTQVQQYRVGQKSIGDYVQELTRANVELDWAIELYLQSVDLESQLDLGAIERERNHYLNTLVPKLNTGEQKKFRKWGIDFKSGQIGQAEFYLKLKQMGQRKQVFVSRYPSFEKYIQFVFLSDQIQIDKLFMALKNREALIYDSLIQNETERNLVSNGKGLYLAKKLINFSLTPDEWSEYQQNHSLQFPSLKPFEKFYLEAKIRDEYMAQNLLREIKERNATSVILVAGGYHSPGIHRRLKRAGINVVPITPTIEKIQTTNGPSYLSLFSQEKSPLADLFQGEVLFVPPNPTGGFPSLKILSVIGLSLQNASITIHDALQYYGKRFSSLVKIQIEKIEAKLNYLITITNRLSGSAKSYQLAYEGNGDIKKFVPMAFSMDSNGGGGKSRDLKNGDDNDESFEFMLQGIRINFEGFRSYGLKRIERSQNFESSMIQLENHMGDGLQIRYLNRRQPGRTQVDHFLIIGNRVYTTDRKTPHVDVFKMLFDGPIEKFIGNDQLLQFVGLKPSDILRIRRKSRNRFEGLNGSNLDVYLWDELGESLSRYREGNKFTHDKLLPYDVSEQSLEFARNYIVKKDFKTNQWEYLHQLAILSLNHAYSKDTYAQVVRDRLLLTDKIYEIYNETNRTDVRRVLDSIISSIGVLAIRQGEKKRHSDDISLTTAERVTLKNSDHHFSIESSEATEKEFERLKIVFKQAVREGHLKPYFIVNVQVFSPQSILAYMKFLYEMSEAFNGQLTFLLVVHPGRVLDQKGVETRPYETNRPAVYTSKRAVLETFGENFYKDNHVANIMVGPKKRSTVASLRYGFWGEVSLPDGKTFLENGIDTIGSFWLTLPKKGKAFRLAVYGGEKITFTDLRIGNKPISELTEQFWDEFQMAVGGPHFFIGSSQAQTVIKKLAKKYSGFDWSKIVRDKEFEVDIEKQILDQIDHFGLSQKTLITTDENGFMRHIVEEPTVDNLIDMGLAHGNDIQPGHVNEARLFIMNTAESDIRLVQKMSQTAIDSPRATEDRRSARISRSLLADHMNPTSLTRESGINSIHVISFGEDAPVEDPTNLSEFVKIHQSYLKNLDGNVFEDVEASESISIHFDDTVKNAHSQLNNVRLNGKGVLRIGPLSTIENSSLGIDGQYLIPPRTLIKDSSLDMTHVKIMGEGVVVFGVDFSPGELKDPITGELIDELILYPGETVTQVDYPNGEKFLVRMIHGLPTSELTIPEVVGGHHRWRSIQHNLGFNGRHSFYDALSFPISKIVDNNPGNWKSLVITILSEQIPTATLIQTRTEIMDVLMNREKDNHAHDKIMQILYTIPSFRLFETDTKKLEIVTRSILAKFSKKDINEQELDLYIQEAYMQMYQPQLSEILEKVSYEQVESLSYGEALFRVWSEIHPKIFNVPGFSEWKDIYQLEDPFSPLTKYTKQMAEELAVHEGATDAEPIRIRESRWLRAESIVKAKYFASMNDMALYGVQDKTRISYEQARNLIDSRSMAARTHAIRSGDVQTEVDFSDSAVAKRFKEGLKKIDYSHIRSILLAGGPGSRLYPIRKLFIQLGESGFSFVQESLLRLIQSDQGEEFIPPINSHVLSVHENDEDIRNEIAQITDETSADASARVLRQPAQLGTMAAVLWSLAQMKENGDDLVLIQPSDHLITNPEKYQEALARAFKVVQDTPPNESPLILMGVEPTILARQWSEYGILQTHRNPIIPGSNIYPLTQYKEKPPRNEILKLDLSNRNLYINLGIIVARKSTLENILEEAHPQAYQDYVEMRQAIQQQNYKRAEGIFLRLPSHMIDVGFVNPLLRPSKLNSEIYVVEGDFEFQDIGTWESLQSQLEQDGNDNVISIGSEVDGVSNSIIFGESQSENIIMAENLDGTLVAFAENGDVLIMPIEELENIRDVYAQAMQSRLEGAQFLQLECQNCSVNADNKGHVTIYKAENVNVVKNGINLTVQGGVSSDEDGPLEKDEILLHKGLSLKLDSDVKVVDDNSDEEDIRKALRIDGSVDRAVIFSTHPDDEAISMGAFMRKLKDAGLSLRLVTAVSDHDGVPDGFMGASTKNRKRVIRLAETIALVNAMGIGELNFNSLGIELVVDKSLWKPAVGKIVIPENLDKFLSEEDLHNIDQYVAEHLSIPVWFAHFPFSKPHHIHHEIMMVALFDSLARHGYQGKIVLFESFEFKPEANFEQEGVRPNLIYSFGKESMNQKIADVNIYESQLARKDYDNIVKSRNYRNVSKSERWVEPSKEVQYAERFVVGELENIDLPDAKGPSSWIPPGVTTSLLAFILFLISPALSAMSADLNWTPQLGAPEKPDLKKIDKPYEGDLEGSGLFVDDSSESQLYFGLDDIQNMAPDVLRERINSGSFRALYESS